MSKRMELSVVCTTAEVSDLGYFLLQLGMSYAVAHGVNKNLVTVHPPEDRSDEATSALATYLAQNALPFNVAFHDKTESAKREWFEAESVDQTPTKRAYNKSSGKPTMPDMIISHFTAHPKKKFTHSDIGKFVKKAKFSSSPQTAMANVFHRYPNAPIKRIEPGVFQYDAG